jgi:hypothetical protein
MQQETYFKRRAQRDLKTLGMQVWVLKTQEVATRGIPDFLICAGGLFMAVELKKDDRAKVAPLQKYTLTCIQGAGGETFVATPESWPEIFATIKSRCYRPVAPSEIPEGC